MAKFLGRTLLLLNDCRLDCAYCGYGRGRVVEVDLAWVEHEARARAEAGEMTLVIASNDPVEHPQFDEVLARVEPLFERVQVETTGLRLAAELDRAPDDRAPWALSPKLAWAVPYVSSSAALHDRVVGRAGHHAVVSRLLADTRLDVLAQVLLVRDVVADGNLGRTLGALSLMGRRAALRAFTPRLDADGAYFAANSASHAELWGALEEEAGAEAQRDFLAINPQCITACTVPQALQAAYYAAFRLRIQSMSEALEDTSLANLVACPRERTCPLGDHCLGVHAAYLKRHGDAEFQPGHLSREAMFEHFAAPSSPDIPAARAAIRARASNLVDLRMVRATVPHVPDLDSELRAARPVVLPAPAANDDSSAVRRAREAVALASRIASEGAEAVAAQVRAFVAEREDVHARELQTHATMDLASRLVTSGRFAEAAAHLAKLPEPRPDGFAHVAHRVRVGLLLQRGVRLLRTDKAEALGLFRRVLALEPDQPDAVRILAKHEAR